MSKMETAAAVGSSTEKVKPSMSIQNNTIASANLVSEVSTSVLVSCQTTTIGTEGNNTIIVSVPNSKVQNVNSVDCNISAFPKKVGESQTLTADLELNNEHCNTKIETPPIALVCEPDIVNHINTSEGNLNNKITKVGQPVSKRGITCKSLISEKRKKEEKKGFRKRKRPSQTPPKVLKKKPKQIRDLEKTLNCLLSDSEQVKDEKACAFAQSYFLKVTETLYGKDDATYNKFMKTMNDFGTTIFEATELYRKVTKIFEGYPELAEEFLAFLLPEQAMECGKFMEYIILTKMNSFCRKLEVYYAKQPSQLRKIYSSLAALASNNEATMDDLRNTILPLLKNNSLLVNMFLELMPTEAPHASSLNYYECMDLKRVNQLKSEANSEDWFETIEVPPPVEDNMYGGEDCVCSCHLPSDNSKRQPKHCISCGTKFIQGRVYIRSGGMLHPAKVSFKEMKSKVLERLSVKTMKSQKVLKTHTTSSVNKKNCAAKGEVLGNSSLKVASKTISAKAKQSAVKGTKGKDLIEVQKKSCKVLSPYKGLQSKKASAEDKHTKSMPKRIRTLSNQLLTEDGSKDICKIGAMPPRKNVSKVVKTYGKTIPKCLKINNESNRECFVQLGDGSRVHCVSQNKSFPNEVLQKCNEKQSIDPKEILPGGGVSVLVSRLSEGESILKTQGKNYDLNEEEERGDKRLEAYGVSCEGSAITDVPSHEVKKNGCGDCCCRSVVDSESDVDEISSHGSSPHVNSTSESKMNTIENTQLDRGSCVDKEANAGSLENCGEGKVQIDGSRCESCQPECEDCLQRVEASCPEITSQSSVSMTAVQECKLESLSYSTENLSCSEAEDISLERMELDTTDENISSEEDKHFVDALHSDSSMESNTKESSQMDIDDSCDDSESCHSSQHDSDTDSDNDHSCDKSNSFPIEPTDTSWTRDEDKVILRTFQLWNGSELVFQKICNQLPNRTADEVRLRFQALMSFLQKITGDPVQNH